MRKMAVDAINLMMNHIWTIVDGIDCLFLMTAGICSLHHISEKGKPNARTNVNVQHPMNCHHLFAVRMFHNKKWENIYCKIIHEEILTTQNVSVDEMCCLLTVIKILNWIKCLFAKWLILLIAADIGQPICKWFEKNLPCHTPCNENIEVDCRRWDEKYHRNMSAIAERSQHNHFLCKWVYMVDRAMNQITYLSLN